MLYFNCPLGGGEIGGQIKTDPEEFAYMLQEVAVGTNGDFAEDVISYYQGDIMQLRAFLRGLLDEADAERGV